MIFSAFLFPLYIIITNIKDHQLLKMQNECPFCNQQYSEDNAPRLIVGCGHTYCEKCLGKMMTQNKGSYIIICPEDGQMVTLKDNNINNIPKNIALLKIAESKKNNSSFKGPDLEISNIFKNEQTGHDDDQARDLVDAIASSNNISNSQKANQSQNQLKNILQKQQFAKIDSASQKPVKQNKPAKQAKQVKQTRQGKQSKQGKQVKQNKDIKQIKKSVQMCKAHQKPLQVVCVIDLKRICVNCAIFGEHKGHEFKSLQQIQNQRMAYYSALLQIMEKKQTINSRISNEQTCSSIMELLTNKKLKMKNNINQKFRKLIQNIEAKQKQSLKNLQLLMQKTQAKLKNLMKIDSQILQKYDIWEQKSFEQIKILQGNNFEAKLHLIFTDSNQQQDVLQTGDTIVEQMYKQQQNLINEVELALENIGLDFNLQIFNHVDNFVDIYDQIKKKKPKTRISKVQSQAVLPGLYQSNSSKFSSGNKKQQSTTIIKQQINMSKQIYAKNIQKVEKIQPKQSFKNLNILTAQQNLLQIEYESRVNRPQFIKTQQIHIQANPIPAQSPLRKQKNALSPSSKFIEKNPNVNTQLSPRGVKPSFKQQSFLNEKLQKPNKKKIMTKLKLSQKYEKILDGILNDQLDTVDLTNAQLGDTTIVAISQLIIGTKTKTVKFIRNKLTDDAVYRIIPYMRGVITLNLSQNLLTQRVLDILIQKRSQLESIKSVILSQNKIMERKAKPKIDKLKNMDIIISL